MKEKSKIRYQQFIDELYEGYVEYDLKGNVTCVNQAIIKISGRAEEELLNHSYKEFMDRQTADIIFRICNEVYRTGLPKKGFAYNIVHKNGHPVTLEGFISLLKQNGKVIGFQSLWRDVTARKKKHEELAAQRSRLEAIFESVTEGIIAFDSDGRVIRANHVVETICGVAKEEITGKPLAEVRTMCGLSCHLMLRETMNKGVEIKECPIGCRRIDRPQQVAVINSSQLTYADGDSLGVVLIIRDITHQLGLERKIRDRYRFQNLIGKSNKMQEIYDLLENLASLDTTVLITGQSGTGKELVARALHYAGNRSRKPFIKVNCSALTESVMESELFGHVKGAFTGAVNDRLGRFEAADGGTLLLDEIADISSLTQLKLLRVLQEKEIERVGESIPRKVDVRVITATNRNLKEKVKNGEFREDLYYRLKVMEITLPALRDRLEDLPLLAEHFCRLFNNRMKKKIKGVSEAVMRKFVNYPWPGNVRELKNVMEHAFVLCSGRVIEHEDLPEEIRGYVGTSHSKMLRYPIARKEPVGVREVLEALKQSRWNKTKAAQLLGVHRSTIHRKIKEHHLFKNQGRYHHE